MRYRNAILALVVVFGLSGCFTNQTVRLTDGQVFSTKTVVNEGGRLQFKANGWDYNLPSYMLATGAVAERIIVQMVKVSETSIVTPEGNLENFQALIRYVDKNATRTSPVIVIMPDVASWPEERRQEFGKIYGEVHLRPNVGLACPWPKQWLPGEPGRELPEK